jgi:hypothetical protein
VKLATPAPPHMIGPPPWARALVTGAMDCAVMGAAQRYSGSSLPLRPPAAARGEDDERPMAYLY